MARSKRVMRPQPRHLRGVISSNWLGILVREFFAPELADLRFKDDDSLLERPDSLFKQTDLEVLFVDAIVDGEDIAVRHEWWLLRSARSVTGFWRVTALFLMRSDRAKLKRSIGQPPCSTEKTLVGLWPVAVIVTLRTPPARV